MTSGSDDREDILERHVMLIPHSDEDVWGALSRKGITRNCLECTAAAPMRIAPRTSDTARSAQTGVLVTPQVADGELFLHTISAISLMCPNCGFLRTFSLKELMK